MTQQQQQVRVASVRCSRDSKEIGFGQNFQRLVLLWIVIDGRSKFVVKPQDKVQQCYVNIS